MGKLTRKNLVLDAEEVRKLAELRGTSESAAVRQAVREAIDHAAHWRELDEILADARAHGVWIDDVFDRLPPEKE